jgi:Rrf2 family protein
MKLSTKGRYGVRLMLDLAEHYGGRPVLLSEIAAREEISKKYLWALINGLKGAGLVHATRGAHGGYVLTRPPTEISVRDILLALEGPICFVDCVQKPSSCRRSSTCAAHDIWKEAAQQLADTLAAITLAGMVERRRMKRELQANNYTI